MNFSEGTLTVTEVQDVARETKLFRFSSDPKINFQAGQFLSLQFSPTAWRAYSIASAPSEKEIEFVVRLVPGGAASEIFKNTKVGDTFPFKGPFGNFLLSKNKDANLIFCGTGTGIAPLRSMIITEGETKSPRPMKLLYGGRNPDDIAYLDQLEDWGKNLNVQLGFSREIQGFEPKKTETEIQNTRITKFLETLSPDENNEFYICGNGDMVQSVTQMLQSQGVSREQIFMERFN